MVAQKPRQEPESRQVVCTHCERIIDIPATAMSVNCRHCHRRVIIEDLKIKAYHAVVRLATAGRVEIGKKAQVVAEVRVQDLHVDGKIKGNVTALGRVELTKKAAITGDLRCRSLVIHPGAELIGHVIVDPDYSPDPNPVADESEVMELEDFA